VALIGTGEDPLWIGTRRVQGNMARPRVGIIGPLFPDSFADNLLSGFENLGCPVTHLGESMPNLRSQYLNAGLEVAAKAVVVETALERRLVRQAAKVEPELIVSVQSGLLPSTVQALKRGGAVVVLWFPDHVGTMGRQLMFSAGYDHLFFKEQHLVDRSRKMLNLPAHYLPEACNPLWHRPAGIADLDLSSELVVAGNMYPYRTVLLERLQRDGVRLALFGPGFPRWAPVSIELRQAHSGTYLARKDKASAFRSGLAVLNTLSPAEYSSANCRLFEACGSGATVITEARPDVDDLFENGKEVLVYDSYEELLECIEWVRKNEVEARNMGDRASIRAHREYSYEVRLRQLIDVCGFSLPTGNDVDLPHNRPIKEASVHQAVDT
jgi:glycosyltransferase involved in cell wall biosynthesis